MIFKLNNIILVTSASAFVSSNLLDGVDATLQQQQLRGRKLNVPTFCPQQAPANGSFCRDRLPRGWRSGHCDWNKSSWNSAGKNISEHDYCICSWNVGNWQCTKDTTPVTILLTTPVTTTVTTPVITPGTAQVTALVTAPVTTLDDNFCPPYAPTSQTTCGLTGMWVGTCYYSSSAQENETPNNNSQTCLCQNGLITCTSQP